MPSSKGYAAQSADSPLALHAFSRRNPGPIEEDVKYRFVIIMGSLG